MNLKKPFQIYISFKRDHQRLLAKKQDHINREAHDKTKGFRLQKLRAVELMIDSSELSEETVMHWAIEKHEDVYQNKDGEVTLEEDKSYAPDGAFSFNSLEIEKALVSFMDVWSYYEYSKNLHFNFYSTNQITKESNIERIRKEGIVLPDDNMLSLAIESPKDPSFIDAAKGYVKHYMKRAYGNDDKRVKTLNDFTDDEWIQFFTQIRWSFEMPNETELNHVILEKIRKSSWFSSSLNGKEELIKALLMEKLDKGQTSPDFLTRTISRSEVELIFEKLRTGRVRLDDPLWQMWESIPAPQDKRKVTEKIQSRWPEISARENVVYARKAVAGGMTRVNFERQYDFLALRYQVYEVCEEQLNKMIGEKRYNDKTFTVDSCIRELSTESLEKLNDLKKTYSYSFDSQTVIDHIILELFDSCYLSFDAE